MPNMSASSPVSRQMTSTPSISKLTDYKRRTIPRPSSGVHQHAIDVSVSRTCAEWNTLRLFVRDTRKTVLLIVTSHRPATVGCSACERPGSKGAATAAPLRPGPCWPRKPLSIQRAVAPDSNQSGWPLPLSRVAKPCAQPPPAAVVDLCSGKGFFALILALECPDLPVIAVDLHPGRPRPSTLTLTHAQPLWVPCPHDRR